MFELMYIWTILIIFLSIIVLIISSLGLYIIMRKSSLNIILSIIFNLVIIYPLIVFLIWIVIYIIRGKI